MADNMSGLPDTLIQDSWQDSLFASMAWIAFRLDVFPIEGEALRQYDGLAK
jgi:hypothetical protein